MLDSLKNRYLALGVQRKILIPTAAVLLFVGLLIFPATRYYLNKLDQRQSDKLGHILVTQLAEQARQPLLYNDNISLQVVVTNMVRNVDEIHHAVILDDGKQLRAQAIDEPADLDGYLIAYSEPIMVEDTVAGHAELRLSFKSFHNDLMVLFWVELCIWVLFSVMLCAALNLFSGDIARRLIRITVSLPSRAETEGGDEVSQLEARVKPLLVKSRISELNQQDETSLTLTISCMNIERLRTQLTRGSYRRLLTGFDAVSNSAIAFFEATRLAGTQHCIHLRFFCHGDMDNAMLRAISCYLCIAEMVRASAPHTGTGLVLCAALRETGVCSADPHFFQNHQHEVTLQKLVATTALAEPWQLLLHTPLLEKAAPGSLFEYAPFEMQAGDEVSVGAEQVLFKSLNTEYSEVLLDQQDYLRAQLFDVATPHEAV